MPTSINSYELIANICKFKNPMQKNKIQEPLYQFTNSRGKILKELSKSNFIKLVKRKRIKLFRKFDSKLNCIELN